MTAVGIATLLSAFVVAVADSGLSALRGRQSPEAAVAIRDVTVIDVANGARRAAMTVLLRGERIGALGPVGDVPVPAGARVIAGTGKFLIPGLIDLHTHVSKTRASALGLFVAHGVTTLRDMGGDHQELLQWRRDITAGRRVGPRLLLAGPYLESAQNIERMRKDPVAERVEPFERLRIGIGTVDQARQVVASLAAREVDFLKIRTVQSREIYRALNEAAHAHGLKLVGHVSGLPPALVLDAGQDAIEHTFFPTPEHNALSREERLTLWRSFRDRRVPIVPTLVTAFEATFPSPEHLRAIAADDEGRLHPQRGYVSKFMELDWREQASEASVERTAALRKIWEETTRRDLREMHESGMDVLAGSDVAVINIYPGASLHDELALLVREVGMTPAEALDRATRRSARLLGIGDSVGSVERGKVADLLLLDADPLLDISHTKKIAAVFLRGHVFDVAGIAELFAQVRQEPDLKVDDWGRKGQ